MLGSDSTCTVSLGSADGAPGLGLARQWQTPRESTGWATATAREGEAASEETDRIGMDREYSEAGAKVYVSD